MSPITQDVVSTVLLAYGFFVLWRAFRSQK